ncbi:DUF411 domain-containing protein [Brucella intermedia]|uniref:DUF411 domain-containing protein n=1 Tax=Brucella intermedia M86 TaxID=1234597 RepID=M5JSW9_9HYPH|nr:DUF411 domain-containing protein [Brucella intermedia]ELT51243.1 hypothetical protein D584_00300 [Brucella intermedia M86]
MTLQIKAGVAIATILVSSSAVFAAQSMQILSTSGCGCCVAWERHLEENGYETELKNLPMADLWQRKMDFGLKQGLTSCHTALIGGYVVEGHVPAREISRLLTEKPDAIGLVVPDMPYGSPGMGPQEDAEPYDVLLLLKDGSTEIFASYR